MLALISISSIGWLVLWLIGVPKPVLDFVGLFVLVVVAVWLVLSVAEWLLFGRSPNGE
jgi:hypothetical protein